MVYTSQHSETNVTTRRPGKCPRKFITIRVMHTRGVRRIVFPCLLERSSAWDLSSFNSVKLSISRDVYIYATLLSNCSIHACMRMFMLCKKCPSEQNPDHNDRIAVYLFVSNMSNKGGTRAICYCIYLTSDLRSVYVFNYMNAPPTFTL